MCPCFIYCEGKIWYYLEKSEISSFPFIAYFFPLAPAVFIIVKPLNARSLGLCPHYCCEAKQPFVAAFSVK